MAVTNLNHLTGHDRSDSRNSARSSGTCGHFRVVRAGTTPGRFLLMVALMIVDEDVMFADALCVPLEVEGLEIVGLAVSKEDAIVVAAREAPEIALIAIERLDGATASDLGRAIRDESPSTQLVAVASRDDEHRFPGLLEDGFCAILSKDVPLETFVDAVRQVAIGGCPAGGVVVRGRMTRRAIDTPELAVKLTRREREVLEFLVEGASGPDIAEELDISINTVRSHIQSLFSKLHVHSQLEAAALAVRSGLVEVDPRRSGASRHLKRSA